MKNAVRLLAAALAALACAAYAQNYPTKPVRLVISFTPGSSTDIIGRAVAAKLQEVWGQPVVAENRPLPTAIRCSPTLLRTPRTPACTRSCATTPCATS